MKKTIFLTAIAFCGALFTSGCVVENNGFPHAAPGIIITDMNAASKLERRTIPANYKKLGPVEAQAKTVNYVGLFAFGDSSYKYLKHQALEKCPEAKDIINIEVDVHQKNILGIVNEVTTTMRGTAITY